jgi:hypothetical protein
MKICGEKCDGAAEIWHQQSALRVGLFLQLFFFDKKLFCL